MADTTTDVIRARWTGQVTHTDDPTNDTAVLGETADGRPVVMHLSDDHREAMGLSLLDPKGEDDQPSPYGIGADYLPPAARPAAFAGWVQELAAEGRTPAQIAVELCLSDDTVTALLAYDLTEGAQRA
jgi:hypothetical protein